MRLINADKLIELFTPYVSENKKVVYQPRELKIDDIKNAPTVEAIPIEWLKENYGNLQIVRYIMKDWEIEKCTIQKK